MPVRIIAFSCAALATGAGLLVIAGCSNSGAAGTASGSAAQHAAAVPAPAAAGRAAPAFNAAGKGAGAKDQSTRLAPANRSIIYTASMTIKVADAQRAAASAMNDAAAAGGYTAGEQAQLNRSKRQRQLVNLTVKVPVASYHTALSQLAALGKPTSETQQSTDVTQQVADVGSRVTSQEDAIAQLRALLRRAGSIPSLLQVQQQIASDESSLEALQAQQRALSRETTYATITLMLLGPKPHAVVHHHRGANHNFVSGLGAGWRALRHVTTAVLTGLGAALPFLIVIAILGGAGYAGWRRRAHRGTGTTGTSGTTPREAG